MAEEDSQQMKLGFTQTSFLTWLLHMNRNLYSCVSLILCGRLYMTEVVVFFCPETGSYVPKNKPLLETKVRLEST